MRLRNLLVLAVVVLISLASMGHTPKVKYDRKLYRHWIDADADCQDARVEVLIRDAKAGTIQLTADGCRVASGEWFDPYTGQTITDPTKLDVDHMVPLKAAHDAGGWRWTPDRKREYANNLRYRLHLVAVSASANRQKGDKSPDRWRPENRDYWCAYAQAWATVKFVEALTGTAAERTALKEMLETCR